MASKQSQLDREAAVNRAAMRAQWPLLGPRSCQPLSDDENDDDDVRASR